MKFNKNKTSRQLTWGNLTEGKEAKIRKKDKKPKTSLDNVAWMGHVKNKTREKTMGKDTQEQYKMTSQRTLRPYKYSVAGI